MTNPKKVYKYREPINEPETASMLQKTAHIKNEYFKLRVRCLIGLVKKFGKRRREVSTLKITDLEVKDEYLFVTFLIAKKHKRGLFQCLKMLERENPSELLKPLPELRAEWKAWQETEAGHRYKESMTTKKVSVQDKYAKMILEYLTNVTRTWPEAKWLFTSGRNLFGQTNRIDQDHHLSGSQLLRLVKSLNEGVWLHLFRELKGKEISEDMGRTITSIREVQDFLDLENEATTYRYVKRFAIAEAKPET